MTEQDLKAAKKEIPPVVSVEHDELVDILAAHFGEGVDRILVQPKLPLPDNGILPRLVYCAVVLKKATDDDSEEGSQ